MKIIFKLLPLLVVILFAASCNNQGTGNTSSEPETATATGGQEAVQDDESQKDIVKIAVGSPDHSTLVAALTQAELVTALSNAGPFTVFAPTNAAFDKLPAGTVEELMKKDKKADLQNILEYHVSIGVFKQDMLEDGQVIDQVNGRKITISKSADGKIRINGTANIVAEVKASNGLVYVIDEVLLPPAGN